MGLLTIAGNSMLQNQRHKNTMERDSALEAHQDQRRQVEETMAMKLAFVNNLLENDDGQAKDIFSNYPHEDLARIFPDAAGGTYQNGIVTLDMPGDDPKAGFQKQSIDLKPYAEVLKARMEASGMGQSRRGMGLDSAVTAAKNKEMETTARQLGVLKTIAKHPERYDGKSISELPSQWAAAFAQYPDAKIENENFTYTEGGVQKSVPVEDMVTWLSEQRSAYWKPQGESRQTESQPSVDIQPIEDEKGRMVPHYIEYDESGRPTMRPVPIEGGGINSAADQSQGGNKFMRSISALKNVWFPPAEASGPPQAAQPQPAPMTPPQPAPMTPPQPPAAGGLDSAAVEFGDSENAAPSEPQTESVGLNAAPKTTNMEGASRRGADKIIPQNYTLTDKSAGRYSTVKELLKAVKSAPSFKPGTTDQELLELLAEKGLVTRQ